MDVVATKSGILTGGRTPLRQWLAVSLALLLLTPAFSAARAYFGEGSTSQAQSFRAAGQHPSDIIIRAGYDAVFATLSRDHSAGERKIGSADPALAADGPLSATPSHAALEASLARPGASLPRRLARARAPPRVTA